MNDTGPSLDLARLEKTRHHPSGKVTARCPACAEDGGDRSGHHLAIFPDGRFACAAQPGDGGHRRRIFALAGIHTPFFRSAASDEWLARRERERRAERERKRLGDAAMEVRRGIMDRHAWTPPEVKRDSPQGIDESVKGSAAHFLASLFAPADLLWTGEVHESGQPHHAGRWRITSGWGQSTDRIGPMTTPATWQPGTISRAAGQVLATPYTVLDFDGLDGIKPANKDELARHVRDSLALIRWLREAMDWRLAAILWTGGKSLHAWFHTPPRAVLDSLAAVAKPLGMDAGLIGRPEHPCRLPGQVHGKSGKRSQVMWLQARS